MRKIQDDHKGNILWCDDGNHQWVNVGQGDTCQWCGVKRQRAEYDCFNCLDGILVKVCCDHK